MTDTTQPSVAYPEWEGDNPYFLFILAADGDVARIDLDARGWATTFESFMRRPGHWHLVSKRDLTQVLTVIVREGDQPYYTARHIGIAGSGGSNEVVAYGIGKKTAAGEMVRLWQMPDGHVIGGEDVDAYGIAVLHSLGPRVNGQSPGG